MVDLLWLDLNAGREVAHRLNGEGFELPELLLFIQHVLDKLLFRQLARITFLELLFTLLAKLELDVAGQEGWWFWALVVAVKALFCCWLSIKLRVRVTTWLLLTKAIVHAHFSATISSFHGWICIIIGPFLKVFVDHLLVLVRQVRDGPDKTAPTYHTLILLRLHFNVQFFSTLGCHHRCLYILDVMGLRVMRTGCTRHARLLRDNRNLWLHLTGSFLRPL